jgi:hypothetical protein
MSFPGYRFLVISVVTLVLTLEVDAVTPTTDRRMTDDLTEDLREELKIKERPYQFGLAPLVNTSSDENKTGIGGSLFFDYDRFKPIAFQVVFGVYWSKFRTIFPGQRLVSFNGDLDILYRPPVGRLHPYIGAGIGVIANSWPTGEPDSSYSLGGYDKRTPTESLDFGSTLAVHVRTGTFVKISQNLSLFGDIRITTNSLDMPAIRTTFPSGQTYKETVDYKVGAVSVKLGIVIRVRN